MTDSLWCFDFLFAQTDATNALYVKVAFTPRTESLARELMRLLQLAFLRRLPELGWMTAEDKLKAADKITAMVREVTADAWERCDKREIKAGARGCSCSCSCSCSALYALFSDCPRWHHRPFEASQLHHRPPVSR